MPAPSPPSNAFAPPRVPGSSWTFWQDPDEETFPPENSYSWSFLLRVNLVAVIVLLGFFALPPVRAFTGCDLRIIAAGFAIQMAYAPLVRLYGLHRVNPRAREFFSHLVNVIAAVSIPLSSERPLFALWILYPLVVWLDGYANPKSVASLLTSLSIPWLDPLWHHGAAVAADKAMLAGVYSLMAAVVYIATTYFVSWSRAAARRKAEKEAALAAGAERERIGRSLHGTLGAALSEITLWQEIALAGNGRSASEAPGATGNDPDPLTRAQARARSALTELRALVAGMDDEPSTPAGLFEGLRRRAGGLCEAAGVGFALEGAPHALPHDGPDPASRVADDSALSQATAYHIAKIVLEAVTNAVRHGSPASVRVAISLSPLRVEVADDGRGFDPAGAAHGRGLRSLREHAEALGASLEVTSEAGQGTRVVAQGMAA